MNNDDFGQHFLLITNVLLNAILREYVFTFFFKIQKTRLFTFFCQKNVESVVQVFTFLQFEIANGHFHCKTITHMSCYTYNIILKLFIFG